MAPKILFFVNEDWFFYSHRINLARSLIDRGWDVVLATRRGDKAVLIEAAGVRVINCEFYRGKISLSSCLADLRSVFRILLTILHERPDLMSFFGLKPVVLGLLAAVFFPRVPVIATLTGLGYIFTSGSGRISFLRLVIKKVLRCLFIPRNRRLVLQNTADFDDFVDGRIVARPKALLIRGSGVDLEKFVPTAEPQGEIIITFLGRLLRDKGVYDLIFAAQELKRRGVTVTVRLVGSPDPGNPTSIGEAEIKGWVDQNLIIWDGFRDDVEQVWRQSHIAVLPSYREGMPLSLLEAAASGRPLLAANVPGCNDLVENGLNGYLFEAGDWIGLANAIQKLSCSRDLRVKMGKESRKKVEREFGEEYVVAQTIAAYEGLVVKK